MPAARRSARLRRTISPGVRRSRVMSFQPPTGTVTLQGQHFQSHPPEAASTSRMTIQWRDEKALTDSLVSFLSSHPADCRILFSSDGKKLHVSSGSGDSPSGKDKNEIYSVIAKFIFASHPRYGVTYQDNQKKFRESVANRISNLKSRYKAYKAEFRTTGAGVIPGEASNLLAQTLDQFPWYTELDAIWHSNPSVAARIQSSKPGVDHAGDLYMLVHSAGPPTRAGAADSDVHPHRAQPTPSAPVVSSANVAAHPRPTSIAQPIPVGSTFPGPPIDYPTSARLPVPCGTYLPPAIDLRPSTPPPDVDVDIPPSLDDDFYSDHAHPFTARFGDVHHSDDDNMICDDVEARAIGKKRQLAASPSPSPPPDLPSPFTIPQKSSTPLYDSRAAFGAQKPSSRGTRVHCRPLSISSPMSRSTSAPSSTTCNTSSDYRISPTSQTSLSAKLTGSGTKRKKAKSDIQQQFDNISDEIGSMHSNVMSLEESRNHRYQAKLDARAEYARETKKYEYLRETRAQEVLQADANHRRAMESRETDIRARELDIQVREKDIQAHEAEAEIWRLKIQFHQMQTVTGNASASDGGQVN